MLQAGHSKIIGNEPQDAEIEGQAGGGPGVEVDELFGWGVLGDEGVGLAAGLPGNVTGEGVGGFGEGVVGGESADGGAEGAFAPVAVAGAQRDGDEHEHEDGGVDVGQEEWFGVGVVCENGLVEVRDANRQQVGGLTLPRKFDSVHKNTTVSRRIKPSVCLPMFRIVLFDDGSMGRPESPEEREEPDIWSSRPSSGGARRAVDEWLKSTSREDMDKGIVSYAGRRSLHRPQGCSGDRIGSPVLSGKRRRVFG